MPITRHLPATVMVLFAVVVAGCAASTAAVPGVVPPGSPVTPADTHGLLETTAPTPSPLPSPLPSPPATPAPSSWASRSPQGEGPTGRTERALVVRVTDGDTIVVDRGRGPERLRYIGVDTPESVKPGSPVEPMALEASRANEALVAGREVVLERDVSDVDQYGRLLRYVWLRDGDDWLLVNLELVRRGFAQVVTYPPDVRYVERYLDAQSAARDGGLGLWAEPEATPPIEEPGRAGCDTSYPSVCIPPAPPDLDCGDIEARRFEVLPPDPHRFDGNGDGVGCEAG